MLIIIISLLITIASFYLMAYLYKITHNAPKVTAGDVFDEYTILLVGIVIPIVNVVFFVAFAGIVLFKIFKDVKIL
jgi:formate hydrogenlyase subunit 3/multisubunit Na+/H+ antiporter MnhD subunit